VAFVAEQDQWEEGVYQIETTDPVQGGPDGVANLPSKHLANRTRHLKGRTDALQEQLDGFEDGIGEGALNAFWAQLGVNASDIALLWRNFDTLNQTNTQRGEVLVKNRGVVDGCEVTKSLSATRNLHIEGGSIFIRGLAWTVAQEDNAAAVPENPGANPGVCYAYLYEPEGEEGTWQLAVTAIGDRPDDDALELVKVTIPAGNNEINDPNLDNVTLEVVARWEPYWPTIQLFPAEHLIPLSRPLDGKYAVVLDIVDFDGPEPSHLVAPDHWRDDWSFKLIQAGLADNVLVRWRVHTL
jgi:hypothetical protein